MSVETQSGNTQRRENEGGNAPNPDKNQELDHSTPESLPNRREARDEREGNRDDFEVKRQARETARKEEAQHLGYVAEEDWQGKSHAWQDRDTFLATQPLKKRIVDMNQTILSRDSQINQISQQNDKLVQHVAEQQLAALKSSRKVAVEEEDTDKAEEITDQIADMKAEQKAQQAQAQQAPPPVRNERIEQFQKQNTWFNQDTEMTAFAESYAQALGKKRGYWEDSIIDETEAAVKRAYPQKFTNQRRQQASPVEGGSNNQSSTREAASNRSRFTARDLDDDAYKTMQKLVKQGTLTEKQYIEQLDNVGYFSA